MKIHHVVLMCLSILVSGPIAAAPLGTAFTYQGELRQSGTPATGSFDFRMRLYDAVSGGGQVGPTVDVGATPVAGGIFAVELDFGVAAISDQQMWLQIEVRPAGGGGYTLLNPRQKLTAAPQALFALGAGFADEASSLSMDHLRTVGKGGGQYTTVAAALASISGASASNPYLVLVGPGIYDETGPLVIPSHVHVRGMGLGSTIVRATNAAASPTPAAAVFRMGDNSRLSNLSVRHTGTGTFAIGVYMTDDTTRATHLEDVDVAVSGGSGVGRYAVYLNDASPVIRRAHLRASGATGFGTAVNAAVGSVNVSGGFPQALIEHSVLLGAETSDITCTNNTGTGFAFQGTSSSPTIRHSYLCGGHRGVFLGTQGFVRIHNSHLASSSTSGAFMTETTGSATVMIAGSQVDYVGNKHTGTGGLVCVHSYKSNMLPAANGTTVGTACN